MNSISIADRPGFSRTKLPVLPGLLVAAMIVVAAGLMSWTLRQPEVQLYQGLPTWTQGYSVAGVDLTADGRLEAVVALDRGWEHTALAPETGVNRTVVARMSYPIAHLDARQGADIGRQMELDVDALVQGQRPESFQGFYSMGTMAVIASRMMPRLPGDTGWILVGILGVLGLLMLPFALGRRSHESRVLGGFALANFSVFFLLVVLAMATYQPGVLFSSPAGLEVIVPAAPAPIPGA